jgi:hypothetical protein
VTRKAVYEEAGAEMTDTSMLRRHGGGVSITARIVPVDRPPLSYERTRRAVGADNARVLTRCRRREYMMGIQNVT